MLKILHGQITNKDCVRLNASDTSLWSFTHTSMFNPHNLYLSLRQGQTLYHHIHMCSGATMYYTGQ